MMAISVVKLLPQQGWTGAIDEILASASVFFLVSVGLSYAALRVGCQAPGWSAGPRSSSSTAW